MFPWARGVSATQQFPNRHCLFSTPLSSPCWIQWTFSFSTFPFIPTWLFISGISFFINPLDYPPPHLKRSLPSYSFQKAFLEAGWRFSKAATVSKVTSSSSKNATQLLTRSKGVREPTRKQSVHKLYAHPFQARAPLSPPICFHYTSDHISEHL